MGKIRGDAIMIWAKARHQDMENLVPVRESDLLEIQRTHLRNGTAPFSLLQESYLFLASVVKLGPNPLHFLCHPICW